MSTTIDDMTPAEWLVLRAEKEQLTPPLINQITRAFDGVERGNGVTLNEADVIDDHGNAATRAAARQRDTDTRWQDVPDADIERCDWILSFLDAEGFRYYAPAYMVWTLKNLWSSDSLSTDSIVYALGTWGGEAIRERKQEKGALFSREQCRAIALFLQFIANDSIGRADENAAKRTLERSWKQFLESEPKD